MEEETTLGQQLKTIQKEFKKIDSGPIVKLGDHCESLMNILMETATSATRNNIILYGYPGSGRKSAVKYAVNQIYESKTMRLIPIWIDAGVFQTENEFALELVRQIKNQMNKPMNLQKNDIFDQGFTFKNIEESLKSIDGTWILVVERIENLTTQKRQSVLYALLDWLLNNQNRLSLIGITSDVKFTEKLEKRVKSRFSAEYLYCMEYELKDCINVIQQRFESIAKKFPCQQLCKGLINAFKYQELQDFLEKYIITNLKPIQYLLNLVSTMLSLMDEQDLEKQISRNYLELYCFELLKKALELHLPFDGIKYVENLAEPEKQVLICVARLIEHERYPITFNAILSELNQHRKRQQQGSHLYFSPRVLQKATENLIQLKILRLQNYQDGDINGKLDETKNIILLINILDFKTYLTENSHKLADSLKDLAEV